MDLDPLLAVIAYLTHALCERGAPSAGQGRGFIALDLALLQAEEGVRSGSGSAVQRAEEIGVRFGLLPDEARELGQELHSVLAGLPEQGAQQEHLCRAREYALAVAATFGGQMTSTQRPRGLIGEILLKKGLISQGQLEEALEAQKGTAKKLGELLIERGHLSLRDLVSALAEQWP